MVERVDEAVDGADVDEAVRNVKVQVAPDRHHHHPEDVPREQAGAREDLGVGVVRYAK